MLESLLQSEKGEQHEHICLSTQRATTGTLSSKLLPISDLHFGRHQPSIEGVLGSLQGAVQQQDSQASTSGRQELSSEAAAYTEAAREVLQALLR